MNETKAKEKLNISQKNENEKDDAEVSSVNEEPIKEKKNKKSFPLFTFLLTVLLLGIIGVVGVGLYFPEKTKAFLSSYLPPNVTVVQSTPAANISQKAIDESLSPVLYRLAGLEAKLTDLEINAGEDKQEARANEAREEYDFAELAGKIALLEGKVMELESKIITSSYSTQQKALLVMSALALQEASLRGDNFSNELEAISQLCDNAGKEKLKAIALYAKGIKTVPMLKEELPRLIKEAVSTPEPLPANVSWWDRVVNWAKSLVVIRKIEDTDKTNDWQAKLALAEQLTYKGDLTKAVNVLKELPNNKAMFFKMWEEEVGIYEKVKQTTSDLVHEALFSFAITDTDLKAANISSPVMTHPDIETDAEQPQLEQQEEEVLVETTSAPSSTVVEDTTELRI